MKIKKYLNFIKKIYQQFDGYYCESLKLLFLSLFYSLLEGIGTTTFIPIFKFLLDQENGQSDTITSKVESLFNSLSLDLNIFTLSIFIVSLFLLKGVLELITKTKIIQFSVNYENDHVEKTINQYVRSKWAWFVTKDRSELVYNLYNLCSLRSTFAEGTLNGAVVLLTCIVYTGFAIFIAPELFYIVLIGLLPVILIFLFFTKAIRRISKKIVKLGKLYASNASQSLYLLKSVKAYGISTHVINDVIDSLVKKSIQNVNLYKNRYALKTILEFYVILLVVVMIGVNTYYKLVPVANFFALLLLMLKIFQKVSSLRTVLNSLQHVAAFEHLEESFPPSSFLEEDSKKEDKDTFDEITIKELEFIPIDRNDVSKKANIKILKGLNIDIKKGHSIAFVGDTGAGKTTLIDLIIGLLDDYTGQIKLDGNELPNKGLRGFNKFISYVSQESFLLNSTIKDNISFYGEYTDDSIYEFASLACLNPLISKLPSGINENVGDSGQLLSGGEKQRISIARALIRKPHVLILDEATSALDTKTEQEVMKNIYNQADESALIIIAHRLSTIVNVDEIYVLKNGEIIENGNFATLIEKKGEFFRLWSKQQSNL